jgi:hypothetical protein
MAFLLGFAGKGDKGNDSFSLVRNDNIEESHEKILRWQETVSF